MKQKAVWLGTKLRPGEVEPPILDKSNLLHDNKSQAKNAQRLGHHAEALHGCPCAWWECHAPHLQPHEKQEPSASTAAHNRSNHTQHGFLLVLRERECVCVCEFVCESVCSLSLSLSLSTSTSLSSCPSFALPACPSNLPFLEEKVLMSTNGQIATFENQTRKHQQSHVRAGIINKQRKERRLSQSINQSALGVISVCFAFSLWLWALWVFSVCFVCDWTLSKTSQPSPTHTQAKASEHVPSQSSAFPLAPPPPFFLFFLLVLLDPVL